ncbi:helix-turn-helix domain-containing protein [Terrabacter sp. NPDC000476]|uniref:helix-turn-helix domain-containing protein n=1 Tax=Terrabacter sp. NPDC000476 TaxID=3154258 RepID=UPI00331DEE37
MKKSPTVLLTAQQLADRLGEHVQTIRTRTRRGDYKTFALNLGTEQRPTWRYDEALLERWLDTRRAA